MEEAAVKAPCSKAEVEIRKAVVDSLALEAAGGIPALELLERSRVAQAVQDSSDIRCKSLDVEDLP